MRIFDFSDNLPVVRYSLLHGYKQFSTRRFRFLPTGVELPQDLVRGQRVIEAQAEARR